MHKIYVLIVLPIALTFVVTSTLIFVNGYSISNSDSSNNLDASEFNANYNFDPRQLGNELFEDARNSYNYVGDTFNPSIAECREANPCIEGQVVKVINGKSLYISLNNKIVKVELALIGLPVLNQQAMIAASTFARNTCLGSTVLIDEDDGQKSSSIIGMVYCSPTKSLNAMLLDSGYVQLDKAQCLVSEFSNLAWAKSYGC